MVIGALAGCGRDGADAPLPTDADVVVVGAGPVGLLLASELALHRLRVVVVERLGAPVDQPKAGTIHARAAQLLRRRGYLPAGSLDATTPATRSFHFAAQVRFPVVSPAAEGVPVVDEWQVELERFFEAVCLARGVRILRRHEVSDLEQDAAGVRAAVRPLDGAADALTGASGLGDGARTAAGATIRAAWVVGADGGRSIVRRAAGIGATDWPATLRALMGWVRLTEPARAPARWHRTPRGWTLVNLNPAGHSRLITFEFGAPHADRAAPVSIDELASTAERIVGRPVPLTDLDFSGRFSDFSRLADTYRAGRLLLAGDAAHLHYPVGGQGLNLGIQDAFNLGWKLAMVIRGRAPDRLLDTYTAERRPYAERVIAYTRDQARAMDPNPAAAPEQELIFQSVATEEGRQRIARQVSSQDVVTERPAGDTVVGRFLTDRALHTAEGRTRVSAVLSGGRAVLLERSGASGGADDHAGDGGRDDIPSDERSDEAVADLVARWRGRVDHVVERATGQDGDAATLTLVRPDGYVAWAGDAVGTGPRSLEAALRRCFGAPRTTTAAAPAREVAAV